MRRPEYKRGPQPARLPYWRRTDAPNVFASAPVTCPSCGYVVDSHDSFDGDPPGANAVSLCLRCGEPSVYVIVGSTLALRFPDAGELRDINATPAYQRLRSAWLRAFGPAGPITRQELRETLESLLDAHNDDSDEQQQ
jgi:hypothetical protein